MLFKVIMFLQYTYERLVTYVQPVLKHWHKY